MTSKKAESVFRALLVLIAIIGGVGMILLVFQAESANLPFYEVLAFAVSITAVTLAALGAISNVHQASMMRKIAREMRGAVAELKDIDKDNDAIKKRLNQDYKLAKDVAEALQEAGIIDDDNKRDTVATDIERKVRTRIK